MMHLDEVVTPAVLGIVSHELRTPLAAIKGFTSALIRHDDHLSAPERLELLHEIDQTGDRLNEVIEHLLLLAEVSTGTPQLVMEPIDMHMLVHDAVRQAEQRAGRGGSPTCSFVVEHDTILSVSDSFVVSGDPHYLTQLLEELLENACKFSPQGGVVAVILHLLVDQPSPTEDHAESPATSPLLISVRDAGIGIPPDDLKQIITPFFVADDRLTRAAGGMGIGLALCRRIAELHGGPVWAVNNPQQGSTFHLRLPLD
jgi:two-component system sensor histidine kinase ChiS